MVGEGERKTIHGTLRYSGRYYGKVWRVFVDKIPGFYTGFYTGFSPGFTNSIFHFTGFYTGFYKFNVNIQYFTFIGRVEIKFKILVFQIDRSLCYLS